MPNNEEHSESSFQRYGERASDLHEWMDAPYKMFGPSHRFVRHGNEDVKHPPQFLIDEYGLKRTRDHMIDHVLRDAYKPKGLRRRRSQPSKVNVPLLIWGILVFIMMGLGVRPFDCWRIGMITMIPAFIWGALRERAPLVART